MAVNQRSYNDNDRAEVLALQRLGEGPQSISSRTGIPERTVVSWTARMRQVAIEEDDKELLNRDYRLALRADDKLHDAIDFIDQDSSGERAYKAMIALNAVRGTAVDKILKRKEHDSPTQSGPFAVFVIQQGNAPTSDVDTTPTIEAPSPT